MRFLCSSMLATTLTRNVLTVLLFLMVLNSKAQTSYRPGYIILKTNDTVYGGIKDRSHFSGEVFLKIKFKRKGRWVKRYTADDLLGYYNGEHRFESVWYHEEGNFFNTTFHSSPAYTEKAFLIVYSKGPLSVYGKEFTDADSSYPNSFPLLKREGDAYFVRSTQGILGLKKKQLAAYFSDCPTLANMITERSIKKTYEVAEYYNNHCSH